MNIPNYSILLSVYDKENPIWFKQSLESMISQTVKSDDFVIVCDGPLTKQLYDVLHSFSDKPENHITILQLEKNSGLGNALNEGLKLCKNEIVARMDSDDISKPERCEKELEAMMLYNADIVSCALEEFVDDTSNIVGKKVLPERNEEIRLFSHKRNPFNHPTVMFKKSVVISVGSYDEKYHLFEDYYLWVRMLIKGAVGYNIQNSLLFMRVSTDMYKRRGGRQYACTLLNFYKWMRNENWITKKDYLIGAVLHAIICVLPSSLRGLVYKILHK